jgi:hypothetical protein
MEEVNLGREKEGGGFDKKNEGRRNMRLGTKERGIIEHEGM